MITKFIEATQPRPHLNWGKFMLARFTADEWDYRSAVDNSPLIKGRGWHPTHILIVDLQTGEGAIFTPGGIAKADLEKHKIWVCPMFEPFLNWLYQQDVRDLSKLPNYIEVPAEFALSGYRRKGPPAAKA